MKKRTSFNDHLGVIQNSASEKTASLSDNSLLSKLAQELKAGADDAAKLASAPTAEGEQTPADAPITGAAPAVVASTEAVTNPQVALAGGDLAEATAGEQTPATKPTPDTELISDGDGTVVDGKNMHKTDAATAEAAKTAGLTADSIADAVIKGLQKVAYDEAYLESAALLKEAGLLDGYEVKGLVDGVEKTASQGEAALAKLAAKKEVSFNEIISAAAELQTKIASDEEGEEVTEAEKIAYDKGVADALAFVSGEVAEDSTVKEASQDPEVMAAVQLLTSKGLIGA